MYNLACSYDFADGIEQNYKEAAYWYQKALDNDFIVACNNLGVLYEYGHGINQDLKKAFELYLKAANSDDANGCFNLANCYLSGKGVSKDIEKAKQWFKKADELGHSRAKESLKKLSKKTGTFKHIFTKK